MEANKTVNVLEFPMAFTIEGSELLTIAGAAEWLKEMENVTMREATVDLQRMRASNILKQGLILPRRVTIKGCIQMSTLQEYACVEPEGVCIGKEHWPGGEESMLSKPLKRWADKILQTIEEVWEADNGQTCGTWVMDAEPMDHVLVGKQHEIVKGISKAWKAW